jgi:hypothetical protein
MAVFVPFNCFIHDLGKGVHDLENDVFKIYLTNTAPDVAADAVYADLPDLATGGGYTAGGITTGSNTWSQVDGLASFVPGVGSVLFEATTGFGPFRYAVLYNFTAAGQNLCAYYDNGAPVTLGAAGEFEVDLAPQLFTLEFS